MSSESTHGRVRSLAATGRNLRRAAGDLVSQEFEFSTGHLATVLNGCLFAPSILTFWFVNGVLDFSTAVAIGAVQTGARLQVRLYAYLLLVPTFLVVRATLHLLHPTHRRKVLSGSCPRTQLLSLDWFSVGILATGLPIAVQKLGPWLSMNAVFLVGVFLVPRVLSPACGRRAKVGALVGGSVLFLYANYGAAVTVLPAPRGVVGPVATLALSDATTTTLVWVVNSLLVGPPLVAAFGVLMNHLLTRPELADVPLLEYTLPERDPDGVVVASAAGGTIFYLLVGAAATGRLLVVP
jgi:hypothetical protein